MRFYLLASTLSAFLFVGCSAKSPTPTIAAIGNARLVITGSGDFGNVAVNGAPGDSILTVSNNGEFSATFETPTTESLGLTAPFSLNSTTCGEILSAISGSNTCILVIRYRPVSVETTQQNLAFAYNDVNGVSRIAKASLSGASLNVALLTLQAPSALSTISSNITVSNASYTTSSFALLIGVAVDASGTVFVSDNNNKTVKKIAPNSVTTLIANMSYPPQAVAVDTLGNTFVTTNLVQKIDSNGVVTTVGSGFNAPQGIAIDKDGYIYVSDANNSAVKKVSSDGNTIVTIAAGVQPRGVGVDSNGNVFFIDVAGGPSVLKKIAFDGTNYASPTVFYAGPLGEALAIDAANNIYVSDGSSSIIKISPFGLTHTVATGLGTVMAIAVDLSDNLYIAGPTAVTKIAMNGTVSALGISVSSAMAFGMGSVDTGISPSPSTAPVILTLSNASTVSATLGSVPALALPFSVSSSTCPWGATFLPSASCTITLSATFSEYDVNGYLQSVDVGYFDQVASQTATLNLYSAVSPDCSTVDNSSNWYMQNCN